MSRLNFVVKAFPLYLLENHSIENDSFVMFFSNLFDFANNERELSEKQIEIVEAFHKFKEEHPNGRLLCKHKINESTTHVMSLANEDVKI